jgi:hypothetical protein
MSSNDHADHFAVNDIQIDLDGSVDGILNTPIPNRNQHHPLQGDQQQQRRQPPPPAGAAIDPMAMVLSLFQKQQEAIERQQKASEDRFERLALMLSNKASPQDNTTTIPSRAIGSDIDLRQQITLVSDAMRGQDCPTFQPCLGLTLQRYIADRFKIFSIPHLIFKEDPETMKMIKVKNGTAVEIYKQLKAEVKFTFANLVPTQRAFVPKNDKDKSHQQPPPIDNQAVRLQLERCERAFVFMLNFFIESGVAVLECYATLSFGFNRGGAKVIAQHNTLVNKGIFDPERLWPKETESENFR